MGLKKREEGVNLGDVKRLSDRPCAFSEAFPTLAAFVVQTSWPEGGGERATGSILLFVQDNLVKCRLVDNDSDEVCFLTGGSLLEVLEAAEGILDQGRGDWRKQKPFPGQKKR